MNAVRILALLALIAPGVTNAATLHVPAEYPTIQAGVDAALEGDTVLVAPGTYTGPGNYDISWYKGIAVIGEAGSAATIIDCEGNGRGFRGGQPWDHDAAHLSGFTIRNGSAEDGGGAYISGGHNFTIEDLDIQDCVASNKGGGLCISYSASIQGCRISGCSAYEGGGIFSELEYHGTVENVVIEGNTATHRGGGYIGHTSFNDASLVRVTLVRNSPDAIYVNPATNLSIEQSIVAFNVGDRPAIDAWTDFEFDISCSDVYGNPGGNYAEIIGDQTGLNGNISLDPLFCDLAGGDLHLFSVSPCLPGSNDCGVQMGTLGEGCEPVHAIRGRILTERGMPMQGITVTGPGSVTTNINGEYLLFAPEGWSGEVVPSGWFHFNGFDPPSRSYVNVSGIIEDQDFTGEGRFVCEIPADYAEIQDAVNAAVDGDTLRVAPGTYPLQGPRGIEVIGKGVRLVSSLGPERTTLDLSPLDATSQTDIGVLFVGAGNAIPVLDGFTLTGLDLDSGPSDRALCLACEDGAAPLLRNLIVTANSAHVGKFGLRSIESHPEIENCEFIDNYVFLGAGIVICEGGTLDIRSSRFSLNSALEGGAVSIVDGATATISDCEFRDNSAIALWWGEWAYGAYGGGIFLKDSSLELEGCLFSGNRTLNDSAGVTRGGAIYAQDASLSIDSCTFADNSDVGMFEEGGHICLRTTDASVENSIFAFASNGGGIYQVGTEGTVSFACCDFFGNVGGDFLGDAEDPIGSDGNIAEDPRFCDLERGDFHLVTLSPCLPGNNDCGVQMGVFGEGCVLTALPEAAVPARAFLDANYPNPFNPSTELRFGLPAAASVSLGVFDAGGRRVAALLDNAPLAAGVHTLTWLGRDDDGRTLPSGVYFYRLEGAGQALTGKMLLLK